MLLCLAIPEMNTTLENLTFNRQELANYLVVERSALSREPSKMKVEGLIVYDKNKIALTQKFARLNPLIAPK